jgi:uncharacterized phage protein (TIGR01671 family)
MREILFRGKRIDNDEWVVGNLSVYDLKTRQTVYVGIYKVIPETVGQYTGLCDKNGKKIFEGDICQTKNQRLISEVPFVVEWEDFVCNGWVWKELDENKNEDCFTGAVAKICEVIGNVHDNPELLGVDNGT